MYDLTKIDMILREMYCLPREGIIDRENVFLKRKGTI